MMGIRVVRILIVVVFPAPLGARNPKDLTIFNVKRYHLKH
jgi:hypothetical protein